MQPEQTHRKLTQIIAVRANREPQYVCNLPFQR
jgi:hypothetical protein